MPKVRHHPRGLPHRGGSPCGTSPDVSVDSTDQEDKWRRKRHFDYQGRPIAKTSDRPKDNQRKRLLLPYTRQPGQEGLHHDGSTIVRDRGTTSTRQGGTRSLQDDKMEYGHTTGGNDKYGQGSTGGETAPRQIYQRVRELPDEALCESANAVLQLPEVWPPGQDLQVRGPDLQVLRGEARIDPVPGQRNTKVRKLWAGACHHQSPLPKETGSGTQSKNITNTITQSTHDQTIHQEPSPHPIEKRMGLSNHPRSSETALFRTTINSTMRKRRGTNGRKYQTPQTNGKGLSAKNQPEQEAGTCKGGLRPTTNTQCLDKALRTVNNGISTSYSSQPDKTVLFRTTGQATPTSQQDTNKTTTKRGTNGRCTRNNTNCTQRSNLFTKEDFYREHSSSTCSQENNGGSHGCYQHTHRIDCSHKVSAENGPFQGHNVQTRPTKSTTKGPTNYIKLVHWNAQGAITKTSAIKTAIVQDDIDIVMIQDTRYKRRLDDLPNLRIHGYYTYHRTMDEGGHGMVTLIKHTIPSEEADQIHLGDGTETLSTRIWIINKPLLLHNIYRVDGELDITTPLTREPRSTMVGDFNARDEMWCRYHNRAGRQLTEQLRNLDNFCLMNHPQV